MVGDSSLINFSDAVSRNVIYPHSKTKVLSLQRLLVYVLLHKCRDSSVPLLPMDRIKSTMNTHNLNERFTLCYPPYLLFLLSY